MKKTEFSALCGMPGTCSDFKIKKAIEALLQEKDNHTIAVPADKYLDTDDNLSEEDKEEQLIEFLEGEESVTVNYEDENGRESYIASIRLDDKKDVVIRVYDYYAGEFRKVELYALNSVRDAMSFVLEYAEFEPVETTVNAGNLSPKQLEALDEFLAAARRLNDAGVSLLWDEDGNSLCAANRDAMQDESFWRLEPSEEQKEGTLLLSDNASNALDIEITTLSRDYDLYYYPKN